MKINNKEINTLKINNKLVKSIRRLSDDKIIYNAFDGLRLIERTSKTILSSADNDIAYFDVQLTKNNNPVSLKNIEVELYQEGVLIDSHITDSNGKVVFEYIAGGIGNTSFQAKVDTLVSKRYEIQDCSYYNPTEKTMSTKNTNMLYDTNMAVQLSTNAEISFDINILSNNDWDYRYWILPKSQFNGMNYPPYAFLVNKRSSQVECNEMLDGTYRYSLSKIQSTKTNEYVTMKYVKNGTEISAYVDDTLIYTNTCEWIDNYTDYCISLMKWSGDRTMLIKNVKIKPL